MTAVVLEPLRVRRSQDRERTRAAFARLLELRDRIAKRPRPQERAEYERLRSELVVMHLNVVRALAAKFANRGQELDDLIQVGSIALIKAIDRYDVRRSVQFTTYATPTILGEIKRHFRDKAWVIKVPRRLQELNYAVNQAVQTLGGKLARNPLPRDLAQHLGISERAVTEAQGSAQAYHTLSLDAELTGDQEWKPASLLDFAAVEDPMLARSEDRVDLARALRCLSGRERLVLFLRYYEEMSQHGIARKLKISQMHISRLQRAALAKVRAALTTAAPE